MVKLNPCPNCGGLAVIEHVVEVGSVEPWFERRFRAEARPVCIECRTTMDPERSDWIQATDPRDDPDSALNAEFEKLDEIVADNWNGLSETNAKSASREAVNDE